MDWETTLYPCDDQPLDRLADAYSHTSIFRTIAVIGDSLASGEFETRTADGTPAYHDMYEYSWGQFLARKNGITVYNFSRGGMTAKEYLDSFAEERGFFDPDKRCQAYIMALGVNDIFNHRMDIGSIDDVNVNDPSRNRNTFAGYYAAIVSRYRALCPDAPFFFVTVPKSDDPVVEELSPRMRQLFYDLAAVFDNSYVIDLYKYGPIYDERFREQFYLHGHMNPSGYLLSARLIDSYIDWIVRHHPSAFKTIGFVNTDIAHT